MSSEKSEVYKYPVIHSTPKSGTRFYYSSRNDKGHFGISKIIFGETGVNDVIVDMDGKYGMTHGAMAIKVDSIEEAENLKRSLMSDKFTKFLESMLWSNFRIEWKMFKSFKKDFWKEFI